MLGQPTGQRQTGPEVSIDPEGLEVTSADGGFSLDLGSRLHVDWSRHFGNYPPAEAVVGTDVQRARISVSGRFDARWIRVTAPVTPLARGKPTLRIRWSEIARSSVVSGRCRDYPYLCPRKACESYGKSIRRAAIEGEFEELLHDLSSPRHRCSRLR
jgi:hypothetical protein